MGIRGWNTWEDMEKDLVPYFNELFKKCDDDGSFVVKEIYNLEEIIDAVQKSFYQLYREMRGPLDAYNFSIAEVYKMPGNIFELTELLLDSQVVLFDDIEKDLILEEWNSRPYSRNKTKESSAPEDFKKMEDSFKIKITALSKATTEMQKFLPRRKAMIRLFRYAMRAEHLIKEFPSHKYGSSSFREESSSRKRQKRAEK